MGGVTRAERNIAWIEKYCRVPEGAMVGQQVRLRPWQQDILRGIYDADPPLRRAIISFPRKNGKTGLSSMLLLLHLAGPGRNTFHIGGKDGSNE
jgi:phage terminase large subunit-like protein